ncbi:translocation/assembly module TamB [Aquimarina sp. ERC-38]|uniref:translocation/assembly module TamB domain-containing protein n=1 Tax=Aquimarina sp. ERC-38 TaxID=2949996 RepID=UPI002246E455|nr:translocation/assembly module TamB domain-containing protein [Aquimarina sp. ERC-38]UZO79708.1 translocation/assembly module TamB [Aquimarina sp. ERC-38]
MLIRDHRQDTLIFSKVLETSILNVREIVQGRPLLGDADLEDVKVYVTYYKNDETDNLSYFIKQFSSGRKAAKPFLLTASSVDLKNGLFVYKDFNKASPEIVRFRNIDLHSQDFKIEGEEVFLQVEALSFEESRGLSVNDFKTKYYYSPEAMKFDQLVMTSKDSKIEGNLDFSYERGGLADFSNKVNILFDITKATVSTNDLKSYYKEFGTDEDIEISNTTFTGILNDFKLIDATISGMDRSLIKGNLRFENLLDDPKHFKLTGDFTNLLTNYYDLVNLLPGLLGRSLPKQLYQLGNVRGTGNAIITARGLDVDMNFYSRLGAINAFVLLGNLDNIKEATYTGNIISKQFDVGKMLGKERLGLAAFDINVDGNGFTLENLNTRVEGRITKMYFNGYTYQNLEVLGILRDPVFDGTLVADDPNVRLTFNGVVDISKTINNYDFVANVDHVDLKKLNFLSRDSIAVFNGDVIMKMKGTSVNNAYGTISFEKTLFRNHNGSYFFDDFEIVSSFDEENVRTITMNSPDIIEGTVRGKFKVENVYDLFRNSIGSLYTNFEEVKVTDNEFMEFNFNIYNKIVDVFFPEIQFAPNTFIRGKVQSDDSEFKLTFRSPQISAFDNTMDNINIQVDNKNPLFNTYISIDSINTKNYDISKFNLINVTLNDTLFIRSEFKGGVENRDTYNLELYHTINEENKSVVGFRKSDLTFKDYTWYLNPDKQKGTNIITFDNNFNKVIIKDILLSHEEENILLSGFTNGKNNKNIKAVFDNVDLLKITPDIQNFKLDGKIQGNFDILQEGGQYFPTASITVKNTSVNNVAYGDLQFEASGNESLTAFRINSGLINPEGKEVITAVGQLNRKEDQVLMDIDLNINDVNLSGFSDLGGIVLEKMRGTVRGRARLLGDYRNPQMSGDLYLHNAGLKIPYLNVDLNLKSGSRVWLQGQQFVFDNIDFTDTKFKTKGILGGVINHTQFSKWDMGLTITAPERLLVLDTKEEEESLYYGTGFIRGDATIKGLTTELVIDVNATTQKGTIFKIPLNDTESLGENNFIHFLSPEEKKARQEGTEIFIEELKGLELNFELDVNNEAEVEVVVDKDTGSSLRGRGAGTLLIEINTNGKFNMWGDFIAYEGSYNFRYGAFLGKDFTVRSGGNITWDGNPTRAILDLSAVYKTEANPAVLLENASINRKIPVEVVVDLKGELIQPDLQFNIDLPNLSSVAKSELEYQLEDQSTKELQALSLVTQGQFYGGTLGSSLITGNLVERAAGLVNGLFAGDDDKFQVGLNYVQGNRAVDQQAFDQFGVTLSTQINNRVLINGRVGVPIGGVSESIVTGDVEVEYLFNEQGNLRGTIFNRQNEIQYIGEAQGYKQGLGLSYSVDFNTFNELWKRIFNKPVQQEVPLKKKDSIPVLAPEFINFTEDDSK